MNMVITSIWNKVHDKMLQMLGWLAQWSFWPSVQRSLSSLNNTLAHSQVP